MAKKIAIIIAELDEDKLEADNLKLGQLVDTIDEMAESLAPHGALEVSRLYLVNPEELLRILPVLEKRSIPFQQYASLRDNRNAPDATVLPLRPFSPA